jgi:hypothetical protein
VEAARKGLIDVKGDSRVPMMKVQELLADEAAKAKEHVGLAAGTYFVEGYMGGVARVHLKAALNRE